MSQDDARARRTEVLGSVLHMLKLETHAMHERIEQVVPLMRPGLRIAQYQTHLQSLLGYYRPLERQLATWHGEWSLSGLNWAARVKSPILEQDLLALGVSPAEIAGVPECTALPDSKTLAGAWGVLYVLEGSTLGGKIISRRLRESLGLTTSSGARFLNPYGDRTGAMWQSFAGSLAGWSQLNVGALPVVASAQQTFMTLTAWLEACQDG